MSLPSSRAYLDHNASAPMSDAVRAEVAGAMARILGNPSSPHASGHEARLALEAARSDVAALLGVEPSEIVFVSGGTEADNLAIWGIAGRAAGGHVVTSAVEHPAVLQTCRELAARGWRVTELPVDGAGLVEADRLRDALARDTRLVSIMAANNETGVLQPLSEISAAARAAGVPLHVDAVQAAGRVPLDVAALGADLVSISSHKIGGPVGIGALYVKEGIKLEPLMRGGGQERRMRPGTEPAALAVGFAAAAREAAASMHQAGVGRLRDRLERRLEDRAPEGSFRINGASAPRAPNTSNITFFGVDNEALVIRLDLMGFMIATGSACSTGSARPSHVLAAMGLPPEEVAASVRISLGPSNTEAEIDALVGALVDAIAVLGGAAAPLRARQKVSR